MKTTTLETVHAPIDRLKAEVNTADMLVTLETFQLPSGWLKAELSAADMLVTLETFHLPIVWLRASLTRQAVERSCIHRAQTPIPKPHPPSEHASHSLPFEPESWVEARRLTGEQAYPLTR